MIFKQSKLVMVTLLLISDHVSPLGLFPLFIIAWILLTSADFVVVGLCPWFSACLPVGLSVCQLAGLLSVPLSICLWV